MQKIRLIGISGKMGVGKDTVGGIIQELTRQYELDGPRRWDMWKIKKYAAKLKQVATLLTGIPTHNFEDQEFKKMPLGPEWGNMTVREFLQKLGTDAMRVGLYDNTWVNALYSDYTTDLWKDVTNTMGNISIEPHWIITDVRFPNEAEGVKEKGGIMIRVFRDVGDTGNHPSETSLDNYEFDYVIYNNGSKEDLKLKVAEMLHYFKIII